VRAVDHGSGRHLESTALVGLRVPGDLEGPVRDPGEARQDTALDADLDLRPWDRRAVLPDHEAADAAAGSDDDDQVLLDLEAGPLDVGGEHGGELPALHEERPSARRSLELEGSVRATRRDGLAS
jgi:hypothetical protein